MFRFSFDLYQIVTAFNVYLHSTNIYSPSSNYQSIEHFFPDVFHCSLCVTCDTHIYICDISRRVTMYIVEQLHCINACVCM